MLPFVDARRGRRVELRGATTASRRGALRRSGVGLRSSVRSEKRRVLPCRRSAEKNVWNQVRTLSTAFASRHCAPRARVRVAWWRKARTTWRRAGRAALSAARVRRVFKRVCMASQVGNVSRDGGCAIWSTKCANGGSVADGAKALKTSKESTKCGGRGLGGHCVPEKCGCSGQHASRLHANRDVRKSVFTLRLRVFTG